MSNPTPLKSAAREKPALLPGRLLFSCDGIAYERVKLVTEGPHGEKVLLARRHPREEGEPELVVVKALGSGHPSGARARLREEVELLSRLSHPGIARVLGHHQREGTDYTVSEYVEGMSLATALCLAALRDEPLSEALGLHVCAELAGALHQAHTLEDAQGRPLGLVHRDVCPANIRLGRGGEVKLVNFALAWSRQPGREPTTEGDTPLGDLDYAAPERLGVGGRGRREDGRSDLFSLGLVLLEVLTGEHLYCVEPLEARVGDAATVEGHGPGRGLAPSARELAVRADFYGTGDVEHAARWLSPPVRALVHRMLRREPSERFATGAELEAELRRCQEALGQEYGPGRMVEELQELWEDSLPLRRAADVVATFSDLENLFGR